MSKSKKPSAEPPSLFDNLDLLAPKAPAAKTPPAVKEASAEPKGSAKTAGRAPAAQAELLPATPSAKPAAAVGTTAVLPGNLTGRGPLKDLMDRNFIDFASYSICSRAIPAVEDGLKPVQRRILHTLHEMDDGRFIKVATVVGRTMAYHPHGDASIYGAVITLENQRYLIQGQGNFGNLFTGAPAAAGRYIECRLTDLARHEVFNPKTTRYVPSYDGRNQEPVYLPSKLPLLLMLGADGIAVGLATTVLPHNFCELVEAEIACLHKKPFELYPDFQTGGVMDAGDYDDGRGKIKVRAVIQPREKNKLVITQLPFGQTTDSLIDNIEDAIKKGRVKVRQIHDFTAEKVEIELTLATGATQDAVEKALFAFTNCQVSVTSNLVVLNNGRPCEMTVSEVIKANVEQLLALCKKELEIRAQELDDLFHAKTLDQIFIEEKIYKRIEKEKTIEGVRQTVLDGFKPFRSKLRRDVTLDDVERLLKIPIRRISAFDIAHNHQEIKDVLAEEKVVAHNLAHLKDYATRYLEGLLKTYGAAYPRLTKVAGRSFKEIDTHALTATELSIHSDEDSHYVGSDVRGGVELFKCSSQDKLLFVWKDGRYKMMPPPDKLFVDKDLLSVSLYSRDKEFTCVYEEPEYGFSYIKRFTFGGMIQNKEYRLAPEKSKVRFFAEGCPDTLYVKYAPAKNQRIHQQSFTPKEVTVRGASARGIQMTTKTIARCESAKGSWWDENEEPSKGVLS